MLWGAGLWWGSTQNQSWVPALTLCVGPRPQAVPMHSPTHLPPGHRPPVTWPPPTCHLATTHLSLGHHPPATWPLPTCHLATAHLPVSAEGPSRAPHGPSLDRAQPRTCVKLETDPSLGGP